VEPDLWRQRPKSNAPLTTPTAAGIFLSHHLEMQ
jgi:hypothetical protein